MDPRSILDKGSGEVPPPTEPLEHEWPGTAGAAEPVQGEVRFPGEDGGKSLAEMAERDLAATLQLLAERAQYITGATGAAIALRDHEEMVCRASAGPSAPEVGAQLQVNSGLSGESVRTQQTLRCDDAPTDERVNRESCEALGIRSVVVMPLIRGEAVIGVFELFSDKANIFEARDITALERMGTMVHTALEHSAAALGFVPNTGEGTQPRTTAGAVSCFEEQTVPADAEPAETHAPAVVDAAHMHVVPIPEVAVSARVEPMGRFEALAAGNVVPRSGIAFHMKMPPPASASAASPVPAAGAPAPAADLAHAPVVAVPAFEALAPVDPLANPEVGAQSDASESPVITANDGMDILEMPLEADTATIPVNDAGPVEEILVEQDDRGLSAAEAIAPLRVTERAAAQPPVAAAADAPAAVPEEPPALTVAARSVIASLRKCEACGFPVSEGRQLCLDCEKKKARETATGAKIPPSNAPGASGPPAQISTQPPPTDIPGDMPRFLAGEPENASWLSTHKYVVIAIVVAVVGIVVVLLLR
jgi:putative methionine-R-sulfoxide reductase with GAF domain